MMYQYVTDAFTFTIIHWPGLAGLALALFALVMLLAEKMELRKKANVENYDMPIKKALRILWENVDHTFGSSGSADRFFFGQIHKKMCSGKLPVVGRLGREGDLRVISPSKCQKLIPMEPVVPINPTALQGVSFVLSPPQHETSLGPYLERHMFWGLRIRSEDLRRVWPETKARVKS